MLQKLLLVHLKFTFLYSAEPTLSISNQASPTDSMLVVLLLTMQPTCLRSNADYMCVLRVILNECLLACLLNTSWEVGNSQTVVPCSA